MYQDSTSALSPHVMSSKAADWQSLSIMWSQPRQLIGSRSLSCDHSRGCWLAPSPQCEVGDWLLVQMVLDVRIWVQSITQQALSPSLPYKAMNNSHMTFCALHFPADPGTILTSQNYTSHRTFLAYSPISKLHFPCYPYNFEGSFGCVHELHSHFCCLTALKQDEFSPLLTIKSSKRVGYSWVHCCLSYTSQQITTEDFISQCPPLRTKPPRNPFWPALPMKLL